MIRRCNGAWIISNVIICRQFSLTNSKGSVESAASHNTTTIDWGRIVVASFNRSTEDYHFRHNTTTAATGSKDHTVVAT